ncbi:hypothetical protein ACE11G_15970 [Gordonia sp. PS3]|uniref:hypothetical protein n=1 Tax=Gordonia sp. PS3 TaxID=3248841 RepID=UPI0035C18FCC
MTEPPPGGHPSWGPGPSPLPRPLAFGMLPQGPYLSEGVAIMCGFAIFNPVLASSAISVEVDGYELAPVKWGRIEVPVVPGTHRFRGSSDAAPNASTSPSAPVRSVRANCWS